MTPEETYVRLINEADALPSGDLRRLNYKKKIDTARLNLRPSMRKIAHRIPVWKRAAGFRKALIPPVEIERHPIDFDRRRMVEGTLTKLLCEKKLGDYSIVAEREIEFDERLRKARGEAAPTAWCKAMIGNHNRAMRDMALKTT